LHATSITIEEGGVIDATGVGFAGNDMLAGDGPGAGQISPNPNEPGGGGAFVGAGTSGTDSACGTLGGAGGLPYSDGSAKAGSAGGDATATTVFGGGDGGGVILLEANTVVIDGTVTAAGGPGPTGVAAGGGAGGTIAIRAFDLQVGPAAIISVAGGDGGKGPGGTNGGGGGGGLILLEATLPMSWAPILDGGKSGACIDVVGGIGAVVQVTPPAECLDLDNDGVSACATPAPDCDDVDPDIYPSAKDRCDGVNNDCKGSVDDPADDADLCEPGQTCDAGVDGGTNRCFTIESTGSGGPKEAHPIAVEFVGGCSTGGAGAASVAGALMAWALAMAARRTRKR
jgi:hypothetical protein